METAVGSRRWLALSVVAIAQLMIVLDLAVIFVALPSIQESLGISTVDRQWVVSAYAIAFGGFLLLGGRLVDYVGRRRMFVVALVGFGLASVLGGLAPNAVLLFAARALQGAFGAVVAPAVLALISVTFTEPAERAKAFGVYGMVSGSGAAIGLIAGGALTEYGSWRWCLLVNIPIVLFTVLTALAVVPRDTPAGRSGYDVAGAVSATAGLLLLAEGFTLAGGRGWLAPPTIAALAAGVALLCNFIVIEYRSRAPLLPLRIVADYQRGLLYLASILANGAQLSMFLFLTYYFQATLRYRAIETGLAFLPFAIAVILAANASAPLLVRAGPLPVMLGGAALAVVALLALGRIPAGANYPVEIMLPEILMGAGVALSLFPLNNVVLVGIDPGDAGVASAVVGTTQQMGASMATALLNTVFAVTVAATGNAMAGYHTVFRWEAVMYTAAFVLILAVHLRNRRAGAAQRAAVGTTAGE